MHPQWVLWLSDTVAVQHVHIDQPTPDYPWLIFPMRLDSTFVILPCKNAFDLILDQGRSNYIGSCFVSWRQFYACSFDSTLITGKFWNIWSETLSTDLRLSPHKLLPFAFTGIALPDSDNVVCQKNCRSGIRIQRFFVGSFSASKKE